MNKVFKIGLDYEKNLRERDIEDLNRFLYKENEFTITHIVKMENGEILIVASD